MGLSWRKCFSWLQSPFLSALLRDITSRSQHNRWNSISYDYQVFSNSLFISPVPHQRGSVHMATGSWTRLLDLANQPGWASQHHGEDVHHLGHDGPDIKRGLSRHLLTESCGHSPHWFYWFSFSSWVYQERIEVPLWRQGDDLYFIKYFPLLSLLLSFLDLFIHHHSLCGWQGAPRAGQRTKLFSGHLCF